jgi:hypothetical protein
METTHVDDRVSLTKGQFVKIYRWHQQLSLQALAAMTALGVNDLATLENDGQPAAGRRPNFDRLTALLGCGEALWERVGVDPGFPGTEAAHAGKTAAKSLITFATHINRIAAMPDNLRHRQMQVIQRELGYIDA